MGYFLAVANRKGGVGKSTTSIMLAHACAVWGNKRVLVLDLDAQSNSSLILQGGTGWIEAQKQSKNVAAYIEDKMYAIDQVKIQQYLTHFVGDVKLPDGRRPAISLLPGSLRFEDMQDELISFYSKGSVPFRQAKLRCASHFRQALQFAGPLADVIILDCAPGLSNATAAALALADKVVVPFRPDAVSEFAVDRIAQIIEGRDYDTVVAMDKAKRRYTCLANYVRPGGRDQTYIDTIAFNHPILATRIPLLPDVANAFDWTEERLTIEEKYAGALEPLKSLYAELEPLLVKRG